MRKQNAAIPLGAFEGEPFSIGGAGVQPAQALRIDQGASSLWAGQIDFDDHTVPEARRTWTTEISIGETSGTVAFGVRLFNFTAGDDVWFDPTRPAVIRQIINTQTAIADGVQLSSEPLRIDERNFDAFWELLLRPNRAFPVVAVSEDDRGQSWVDADRISKRVCGVAHVVALSRAASWMLSERAGAMYSVYNGAIRVYRPPFDPDADYADHPLWSYRHDLHSQEVARRLDRVISFVFGALRRSPSLPEFPRFSELQQASVARRSTEAKESGAQSEDLIGLYEEEIGGLRIALRDQKSEYDNLLASADEEAAVARHDAEEARAELHSIRTRLRMMQSALTAKGIAPEDIPLKDLSQIEEWASQHLSGAIWLAPKAIKETVKNGAFLEPKLIGQALIVLRDYMVPMRRTPGIGYEEYKAKLLELRLEDQPCFGNPDKVRADPSYSVMYRGEKYWCADHIKYGGGTDPRHFFRLYYAWHETDQMLLIGHMPTHLDNTKTN